MMWWYGNGMGAWSYMLMGISNVLFWGLIVAGVVVLIRYVSRSWRGDSVRPESRPGDAEQILAQRFAAGEIDEQEYRQRLEVLREQVHR